MRYVTIPAPATIREATMTIKLEPGDGEEGSKSVSLTGAVQLTFYQFVAYRVALDPRWQSSVEWRDAFDALADLAEEHVPGEVVAIPDDLWSKIRDVLQTMQWGDTQMPRGVIPGGLVRLCARRHVRALCDAPKNDPRSKVEEK